MVEEREEQTQQASSSGVAVNEHDVVLKVLGERRGHRRAVGRVLRGTSRSHSSTTTLQDQHAIPTVNSLNAGSPSSSSNSVVSSLSLEEAVFLKKVLLTLLFEQNVRTTKYGMSV
ncbi:Uncharacterized protein Fot_22913 [Forsythia ovata]|uniref:Uncharacterized protein n=1 Tax=Forsythia ovata TaxID=205694 RepID=A0ABD1UZ29_9LAMI